MFSSLDEIPFDMPLSTTARALEMSPITEEIELDFVYFITKEKTFSRSSYSLIKSEFNKLSVIKSGDSLKIRSQNSSEKITSLFG